MTKFEIFSQPARPVGNRLIQFIRFWLEFIMGALSNSERLRLFESYLPHLDSKSCNIFLLDSLFFQEYSKKI